jgi:membrane protein YdbS with pleckstrin-like domain
MGTKSAPEALGLSQHGGRLIMTAATKSIICAVVFAVAVGLCVTFFWSHSVASFAAGGAFVVGLVLFGKAFKVPNRQ